jgi:hypothetical protein
MKSTKINKNNENSPPEVTALAKFLRYLIERIIFPTAVHSKFIVFHNLFTNRLQRTKKIAIFSGPALTIF